jgi:hypothetical protein
MKMDTLLWGTLSLNGFALCVWLARSGAPWYVWLCTVVAIKAALMIDARNPACQEAGK